MLLTSFDPFTQEFDRFARRGFGTTNGGAVTRRSVIPMAWMQESGAPHEKENVQGGAIALGHPIGATGAPLMTTLLGALERTGGRYGLQTMCEGGGQANVTIIERL